MPQIAVRLSEREVAELDAAIESGLARSRAEGVRIGIAALGERRREREIADQYRRAYGAAPQSGDDAWLDAAARSAAGVE